MSVREERILQATVALLTFLTLPLAATAQAIAQEGDDSVRVGALQSVDAPQLGLDIDAGYQRQTFDQSDADIETIALQPYLQFGNWELSLDLPWQRIEGEYFVNGRYPALTNFCNDVVGLTPQQRLQRIRAGELTARQVYFCNNNPDVVGTNVKDEVSGLGDASLYLNYAVPLDVAGRWFGSATLGYKHDNGEVYEGLGSGTRELLGELAVAANFEWVSAVVSAGYVDPFHAESGFDAESYLYGAVDLGWRPLQPLTLGGRYDYQQVGIDGFDDVESVTIYLRWRIVDQLSLRLFNTDYLDVAGYPDREYGGNVTLMF